MIKLIYQIFIGSLYLLPVILKYKIDVAKEKLKKVNSHVKIKSFKDKLMILI